MSKMTILVEKRWPLVAKTRSLSSAVQGRVVQCYWVPGLPKERGETEKLDGRASLYNAGLLSGLAEGVAVRTVSLESLWCNS